MGITKRDLEICSALALEARDAEDTVEALIAFSENLSSKVDGMPGGKGKVKDPVGDGVPALIEARKLARKRTQANYKHINMVRRAIDKMSDPRDRRYLKLRYIDGLLMREIEQEMHYTRQQLNRIEKKALERLLE